MLDFLFTGWGAFWMTLLMLAPFALMFRYVIKRKSVPATGQVSTNAQNLSRVEGAWLALVFFVFVGVNLASLKYMPTLAAAHAATAGVPVQQIDLTAHSWSYEISNRTIKAGTTVRFAGRSSDTQHGFAVYHPDGRMLFTMMMIPGLKNPTTVVQRFTDPGTYKVRCLEYCGIAHHGMRDELVVVKAD